MMEMMEEKAKQIMEEERAKDRRSGYLASLIYLLLFIVILVLPMLTYPVPPLGQQGILVSFGSSDAGGGNDIPLTQNEDFFEEEIKSSSQTVEKQSVEREVKRNIPQATTPKEVRTSENPDAERISNAKETARQAEVDREQKKAAEAKRQAEIAEQKKYQEAKNQFGSLFGQGKGENASSGNQGDPIGDPTAKALEGVTSGRGVIGGGLDGRGVSYAPRIEDKSQKTGRVVVRVCVNGEGEVISAEYTQSGSTTTDSDLREIAVSNAKRFRFTGSTIDRQCGTISIDFRVK